jgi:hypothetical protein
MILLLFFLYLSLPTGSCLTTSNIENASFEQEYYSTIIGTRSTWTSRRKSECSFIERGVVTSAQV